MVFYETAIFTEQIVQFVDDDSYRELQNVLIRAPESGNVIPRTRGLRKIRWRSAGRGKRGGIRVIYYLVTREEIYCCMRMRRADKRPDRRTEEATTRFG